ncbi:MAG: hypothetical protein GTN76_11765 [Candidatus Aenigmarchaeota archaeon]|nr:hypothetical protein [Candidatus Aenigmarchaeota archaeon]
MTTDEKLEKMQGQLTRVRLFNSCLIGCALLAVGAWIIVKNFGSETMHEKPGVKEIRAKGFVLEDETGRPRAALRMTKDGPNLGLYDDAARPRVGLAMVGEGLGLFLYDKTGKARAVLSVNKNRPGLSLYDETGMPRVSLTVFKDGPSLSLNDKTGKSIWKAP